MEYILFDYIWTIQFYMLRNEMRLRFKVALNIEKQGSTTYMENEITFRTSQ